MLRVVIKEKKFTKEPLLENITITIDKPGIYGLVGKNGHGKTTLFNCVLGFEKFAGSCLLHGETIALNTVAWCPTEPAVYDELTAVEFFDFYKNLLDVKGKSESWLFEVPKNVLIRDFSTGMKKKTYLNAVFQKEYIVYLLDEPFNGLDLESNYFLMQYLEVMSKNSIVIISSHIMEVLYANCNTIFVLKNKSITPFQSEEFTNIQEFLFK